MKTSGHAAGRPAPAGSAPADHGTASPQPGESRNAERNRSAIHRWLDRRRLLWAYLAASGGLAAAATLVPLASSTWLRLALAAVALLALATGIRLQPPANPTGWWLVWAGMAVSALAIVGSILSVRATGDIQPAEWVTQVPVMGQYLLLTAGISALARRSGNSRGVDPVDSMMFALAVFLVLFALVIRPVVPPGPFALAVAIILPLGTLLLLAVSIRLYLSVGVPSLAVGLLLLAMLGRVATTVSVLVPALGTGALQLSQATLPLSMASFVLLGAAGLDPSLGRAAPRHKPDDATVSGRRVAMLAALAIVAPVTLVAEVREAVPLAPPGVTIPTLIAASLLVLLVSRLGLTARTAQRRASELAQRSQDLAQAVREQEKLQRQLRYQALHDPMTGLANRIVLAERMEWVLTRPAGSRQHALALLDLDRFKDVNDTLGHPAGDELLVEVSHRLLAAVPPGATLARLGGDEFAVLLEETPAAQARAWAERVRQVVRRPYRVTDQDLLLSTSVGLFTTDPAGSMPTPTEALRDADLALYSAKAQGRNRVAVFRPELRAAQLNLSRLRAGLQRALAGEELAVHYQPVVDLATGRVAAVEALLRWEPPGQPAVPPAEFIPVAEESGLIGSIGAWVLRQACQDTRPWYHKQGVAVAVNVSPRQLDDSGFADLVLATLRETGLPGRALILEITESSLLATATASDAVAQLDRLRANRVRLAIDDFGTGYSSLAYLSRLPVDIVKLDASFVPHSAGVGAAGQSWGFTRAVLHMVESLRLEAVAEGVETLEQAEALRGLRCQLVQGFLFGKPMPRELLAQSLAESASPDE